MVRPTEDEKAL